MALLQKVSQLNVLGARSPARVALRPQAANVRVVRAAVANGARPSVVKPVITKPGRPATVVCNASASGAGAAATPAKPFKWCVSGPNTRNTAGAVGGLALYCTQLRTPPGHFLQRLRANTHTRARAQQADCFFTRALVCVL